ncbi:NADH dehydrogenase [Paenibacillus solanacearum]|uniref:NADH dehydrogenase n=1 Tax=Paenibacillus solanacearum TaxID=2048548 RepID=A0A916K789_9BACL|nr:NAD(P)/FAD-dependent oxidoreductase [Paenibacillus solanacearum]CAG7650399.1 NADH dehydrogenase [Paenibacillus solanacearum]
MYDCIIVGGGIAGLQASIQLGRYGHRVLVVDKGRGRSTLCRSYHNILGWPEGVSGPELRRLGQMQAGRHGVEFRTDEVIAAAKREDGFEVAFAGGGVQPARTLLAATGIMDRFPPLPGLEACLGGTVYVCPDCDGYEVSGRQTIVLGSGEPGAGMALTLRHWTDRIVYINHERKAIGSGRLDKLKECGIVYEEAAIAEVLAESGGSLLGVRLADGRVIEGERGFIAFGGNAVHSDWLAALGVERLENKHIVTDPRSKQTSVPGVWAAGDVGIHSEQATIAMGEGAQAAIWIHKSLVKSPAPQLTHT